MISIERLRSSDYHVSVSVSGGKDSAATALHLRELGIPFSCVFADTGWEASETYRYIDEVLEPAIGPIARVRQDVKVRPERAAFVDEVEALLGISPSPMARSMIEYAMFPSHAARWCTRDLKVAPLIRHHQSLMADGRLVVSVTGIRADESTKRAQLSEWSGMRGLDAYEWRPLMTWTVPDVIAIHARHGLAPNPLYLRSMPRVGCWPCIHARKEQYAALRGDRRVDAIRALERIVLALSIEAGRGPGTITTQTADDGTVTERVRLAPTFCGGDDGPRGRAPTIDRVMDWAATARGGRQMVLMPESDKSGCVSWGLCEQVSE